MLTITQQKDIANLILDIVRKQFGNGYIAGGAARDWFMGHPAQDIDIFVQLDKETIGTAEAVPMIPGTDVVELRGVYGNNSYKLDSSSDYGNDFNVFEFEVMGQRVQIIQNLLNINARVSQFPVNISKVMVDSKGDLVLTEEAKEGFKNKHMVFSGPSLTRSYIARLITRYENYSFEVHE